MPKQTKKAVSRIATLDELRTHRLSGRPVTIQVTVPAKIVPFFYALAIIHGKSSEDFATWALCQGMTSEAAVSEFDTLLNEVL